MRVHLSRLHYTAMVEKMVKLGLRVDLELPDLAFSSDGQDSENKQLANTGFEEGENPTPTRQSH